MATKYLDSTGLSTLWGKIKALIPQPASTSSENPVMDSTAAIGSSANFARADHIHPSDTSRVPTTRTVNGKALSSDVTLYSSDIELSANNHTTIAQKIDLVASDLADAVFFVTLNGGQDIVSDNTANIPVFTGATTSAAGTLGLVPAPSSSVTPATQRVLRANGTWGDIPVSGVSSSTQSNTPVINILKPDGAGNQQTFKALAYSAKGANNGVAPLNANGKIDDTYLPSYVDDVIEAYPVSGASALSSGWLSTTSGGSALTPETGKIYILMAASGDYGVNSQFRWSGTTYVELFNGGISAMTDAEINAICV